MAEAKSRSTTKKPAATTAKKATAKPAATKSAATKVAPKKTAAPKAATAKKTSSVTPEQHYRMVAEAAYYIAERRGFAPGDPAKDWAEAEAQIRGMFKG